MTREEALAKALFDHYGIRLTNLKVLIDAMDSAMDKAQNEQTTDLPTPQAMGFTGNECTHCHSTRMLQTGHCETCQDCGETSACA